MATVKKLVRVTEVLDYVESKWKEYWWRSVGFENADKISRESASFGTIVHGLVEGHLKGNTLLNEELPEHKCAFKILDYIRDNQVAPFFSTWDKSLEVEVKDKRLGLVGHFDMIAKINGKPCIVDFKTSKKMRKSFPLQKAAYAKMSEKKFKIKIDDGLTIRSHWNQDKQQVDFEVKHYPGLVKTYWPKFKSCLNVYKYFN